MGSPAVRQKFLVTQPVLKSEQEGSFLHEGRQNIREVLVGGGFERDDDKIARADGGSAIMAKNFRQMDIACFRALDSQSLSPCRLVT